MAYSPVTFLREAFDELKKVTWPTRPDITRLTIAVLAISIFVGIFLGGIDLVLEKVIAVIIG